MMTDMEFYNGKEVWHTHVQPEVEDIPSVTYECDAEDFDELQGPRSWVGPALASAIFCFPPTGFVAFYNAKMAQKSFENGDLQAWSRYRARARFLVFVTCVLGVIVYLTIVGAIQAVKHTNSS